MTAAGVAAAACAPKTVIVEREKEVTREVEVQKEVEVTTVVEKEVEVTKIVEKRSKRSSR
jgi:hypothetical protein